MPTYLVFILATCTLWMAQNDAAEECRPMPFVLNAVINPDHTRPERSRVGDVRHVQCLEGFDTVDAVTSYRIVCNIDGVWTMLSGSSLQHCFVRSCPDPPAIPNAVYQAEPTNVMVADRYRGMSYAFRRHVRYYCIKGYELVDSVVDPVLTCSESEWYGPIPTCVRIVHCSPPMDVSDGGWTMVSDVPAVSGYYRVGSEVRYTCSKGYRLVGAETLRCNADQLWSRVPPTCVPQSEKVYFCRTMGLDRLKHGSCKCEHSDGVSVDRCEPFYVGTQVRCRCDHGYHLVGPSLLICTNLPEVIIWHGTWNHDLPYCVKGVALGAATSVDDMTGQVSEQIPLSMSDVKVNTLVIIVATACGILGLLLFLMVLVAVMRSRKHPRQLFCPGMTPPPYSCASGSAPGENDRLRLMAHIDTSSMAHHLPSYDEAIHQRMEPALTDHRRGFFVRDFDHRIQAVTSAVHLPMYRGDGGGGSSSTLTLTSSTAMIRDGHHGLLGSLDTVDVSMSDASTAVTVETMESAVTGDPSICSQRAAAGSVTLSGDESMTSDHAPLLDASSQPVSTDACIGSCSGQPVDCGDE